MMTLTNEQARTAIVAAKTGIRAAINGISEHDVSDLSQTALCTVIEKYDAARNPNLDGFAYRVAYNLALDWMRGAGSSMAVTRRSTEASVYTTEGEERDFTDETPGADVLMARAEFTAEMQAAIASLSDTERAAIQAFMAGESLDGRLRVAKHRALTRLREILNP